MFCLEYEAGAAGAEAQFGILYEGGCLADEDPVDTICGYDGTALEASCQFIDLVDENGNPTKVPEWVPETPEDIELRDSAIRLMNMRKQIGEEMEAHVKYLK